MKIFVKAKPKAKMEHISENTDLFGKKSERHFIVAVKEPATEGKANQAVVRAIAEHLNVPQSSVSIVSGHTIRDKVLEIT